MFPVPFWGQYVCFADEPALRPTGIYLTPGGVAQVTVPHSLVNQGFKIRVGAAEADHSEKNEHYRMDCVSALFVIKTPTTFVSNPLGGGIYIVVPYEADHGSIIVEISGSVVEAPFFCKCRQHNITGFNLSILPSSIDLELY